VTLLGIEEVAERYGFSRWTIYELTRTNQIPHRKRQGGRKLHFTAGDLDEWYEAGMPADLKVIRIGKGTKAGRVVRLRRPGE
jgi:excisionase family DNA binding protein